MAGGWGDWSGGSSLPSDWGAPSDTVPFNAASTPAAPLSVGKTSLDMFDPVNSASQSIGNLDAIVQPKDQGGPLGAIGSIGIPGGPNLGGIVGAATGALGAVQGAVGSIGIPGGPNVGGVVQGGLAALNAPLQWLEHGSAQLRASEGDPKGLPEDLQAQIQQGAPISAIADQLMQRGQGFSSNPLLNTVDELVSDPMNLISPLLGRSVEAIKGAGAAVKAANVVNDAAIPEDAFVASQAADKLGIPQQIVGKAYNGLTGGLTAGGKALTDRLLGGVTSDLFHAYGVPNYTSLRGAVSSIGGDFADKLNDALGVSLQNHLVSSVIEGIGGRVNKGLTALGNVSDELRIGLSDMGKGRSIDVANDIRARAADLSGITDRADTAANAIDQITGMGLTNARTVAGKLNLNDKMMQLLIDARYGGFVDQLHEAISQVKTIGKKVNIDLDRLTPIADHTLTQDRAKALIELIENGGDQHGVVEALNKYDVLRSKFGSEVPTNSALRKYLENMQELLPQEVHGNALPGPIGALRAKWEGQGFDLGFAPETGVKAWRSEDGDMFANPFAYTTSDRAPINARNFLGRSVDALLRDTNQRTIVLTAQQRMNAVLRPVGLVEADAKRIMHNLIDEARHDKVGPRGLVMGDGIETAFKKAIGDEGYQKLLDTGANPAYIVMKAFEGNLNEVGLTQKLTGAIKSQIPGLSGLTDSLYPKFRFGLNPYFQAQQFVESKVFPLLRGMNPVGAVGADEKALYQEFMGKRDPVFEEYANTYLAGSDVAKQTVGPNSALGRALAHLPSVMATKDAAEVNAVIGDFGPKLLETIDELAPDVGKAWRATWGEDPRTIAQGVLQMMKDRAAPLGSNLEEVLAHARPDAPFEESLVNQVVAKQLDESQRLAYKVINLSDERNFLERSINHPFLGLYPFNYYYGKVLPEFARFLFKSPFGANAPGLAASDLETVHRAIVGQIAADPKGFGSAVAANQNLIYVIQTLLPGTPWDIPVNAPAWARHVSQTLQTSSGKALNKLDWGQYAQGQIGDTFGNIGPTGAAFNVIGGASDLVGDVTGLFGPSGTFATIQQQLENASQSYDSILGTGQ